MYEAFYQQKIIEKLGAYIDSIKALLLDNDKYQTIFQNGYLVNYDSLNLSSLYMLSSLGVEPEMISSIVLNSYEVSSLYAISGEIFDKIPTETLRRNTIDFCEVCEIENRLCDIIKETLEEEDPIIKKPFYLSVGMIDGQQQILKLSSSVVPQEFFKDDYLIKTVELPDGMSLIEANAFYNCSSLISVSIPTSMVAVNYSAFYGCSNLQKIKLPKTIKYLGRSVFANCYSLSEFKFDGQPNLPFINVQSFSNCSSLVSFEVPNTTLFIEHSAFEECRSLKSVYLPDNMFGIMCDAFKNCKELSSIHLSIIGFLGRSFIDCQNLEKVEFLKRTKFIEYNIFSGCHIKTVECDEELFEQSKEIFKKYLYWRDIDPTIYDI